MVKGKLKSIILYYTKFKIKVFTLNYETLLSVLRRHYGLSDRKIYINISMHLLSI